MNIKGLFAVPIGVTNINRQITRNELEFLLKQERAPNMYNKVSFDHQILRHPELRDINSFIEASLAEYFEQVYQSVSPLQPYVHLSWANYTERNQSHHSHTHSNSLISGVFYPQVVHGKDSITFMDYTHETIQIQSRQYNEWNSKSHSYRMREGDLIIFPSKIPHMVEPVDYDGLRVSIAFNVFIKGKLGFLEGLNELTL